MENCMHADWNSWLGMEGGGDEVPFIRFSRRRWILYGETVVNRTTEWRENLIFTLNALCRCTGRGRVSIVCFIKNRDIRRNFRSPFFLQGGGKGRRGEFGNGSYPTEFLSFNTLLTSWNALWIIVASATDTRRTIRRGWSFGNNLEDF